MSEKAGRTCPILPIVCSKVKVKLSNNEKAIFSRCKEIENSVLINAKDSETIKMNEALRWSDKNLSPKAIISAASKLQEKIAKNQSFSRVTKELSASEKELVAAAVTVKNSPIKNYLPKYFEGIKTGEITASKAIEKSATDLAKENFDVIVSKVKETAANTGFSASTTVIKNPRKDVFDVKFQDKQGRNLLVYVNLDKELNSKVTLDLEGFNDKTGECSKKMDEIIAYLNKASVPFEPRRTKHANPEPKKSGEESIKKDDYLNQSSPPQKIKN
jgi:hypothetical protein